MNKIKSEHVRELVAGTHGRMFTVFFEKANGEIRRMNCRTGVKKHLKGGESTFNGKNNDHNNIGVWENGNDYRCFNAERVTKLVIDGMEVNFTK